MNETCTVVTGAASGIGRAVADKVLAEGRALVAVDVDAEGLRAAFGMRADVLRVVCDLSDDGALDILTAALSTRFSAVDGFVHAAGFDQLAPLGLVRPDDVRRLMAVHALFPLRFLGWLGKLGHHAPSAACVLISSLAAHEGAKGHAAYASAKGALEGLLRPAAAELAEKGIRLNAVVLGVVKTALSRGWLEKLSETQRAALEGSYPLGLGEPEDAAAAVSFLLSSAARWITGQTLVCDGGHLL